MPSVHFRTDPEQQFNVGGRAAARYNAFNFYALDPDPQANRNTAYEYVCDQYKAMLKEKMDLESVSEIARSRRRPGENSIAGNQ